jgi:hypothetical protein
MGCALPTFATYAPAASAAYDHSAGQNQPDAMADMPNCPHHSGSGPVKPNDPRPIHGGRMSCCPVEVTVGSKPNTVTLHLAPATNFNVASDFSVATIQIFHLTDFISPAFQSGRDRLLETQLLRI